MHRSSDSARALIVCVAALALIGLSPPRGFAAPAASRSASNGRGAVASSSPPDTALTFPRFYESMLALAPDSTRLAEVASVQIARDAGVFVLEQGTLALCRPVAGTTCAAVFSGRGTFLFTPPPGLERDQLARAYGRGTLRRNFQSMVLLFSDTTLSELSQVASFTTGSVPRSMREAVHDVLPYLLSTDSHAVAPHLAKPLLDRVAGGLFFAAMVTADGPLFFAIDPQRVERIALLRVPDNDRYGVIVRHGLEIVSRFRATDDTLAVDGDARAPVRVRHTTIDVSVGGDLELRMAAALELESALDDQRWLPIQIPPGSQIESAEWDGGPDAPHWGWGGNPVLWVRCDPPLSAGERRTLKLSYRVRTLERARELVYNRAALGWYPRLDADSRGTFDLSFAFPSHYQLAASGLNAPEMTRGGVTTSRWTVDPPAPFVSFELGRFRRLDAAPESLPPVSVMLVDDHHAGQIEKLDLAAGAARTPEQRLAAEVAGEATFFRRAFGPLPARPLNAVEGTEENTTHSPQLVRLPMIFASEPDAAVPALFYRAREMARQWWGVQTWSANSHDAWLGEGLANFSAVWYAQESGTGTAGYLELLESWRLKLIEQRDALHDRSTPPSPLCLGARLDEVPGSGAHVAGADQEYLERKATWVIHMLRGLMLDTDDPEEHRFAELMRGFYEAHRGVAFTTGDFRAAAERATGRDLGWFFDQWVDHASIPTYTFSYRVQTAPDGRYVVHARVKQSHVPPEFRMEVPVRVETSAGAPTRLRVQVQGAITEFDLPAMADKPTRVVFNDLGAVLCEVIEAPWQ